MNLKYKKAGFIVKPHDDVRIYLKMAIRILERLGVEVILERIAADMLGVTGNIPREEIAAHCDIIILIGGDGTFLSAANGAVEHQVPVGGFNLGTLGFLTELQKENLEENLVDIFHGGCKISQRKMLKISFKGETFLALNDVVASKGNIARIT